VPSHWKDLRQQEGIGENVREYEDAIFDALPAPPTGALMCLWPFGHTTRRCGSAAVPFSVASLSRKHTAQRSISGQ
jgi:hypothetical protein